MMIGSVGRCFFSFKFCPASSDLNGLGTTFFFFFFKLCGPLTNCSPKSRMQLIPLPAVVSLDAVMCHRVLITDELSLYQIRWLMSSNPHRLCLAACQAPACLAGPGVGAVKAAAQ